MPRRSLLIVVVLALLATAALARREFSMPTLEHASKQAARDAHADEKVTVGAALYNTPERQKLFRAKFDENDYLPVYIVVSNDNATPLELGGMRVQLVTADNTRMEAAATDDLYRRLSRKRTRRGITLGPLPTPTARPEVGVKQEVRDEIEAAIFQARAVEPNASRAGFVFFDVRDVDLRGARLYLTGIERDGKELMFFEIPLDMRP